MKPNAVAPTGAMTDQELVDFLDGKKATRSHTFELAKDEFYLEPVWTNDRLFEEEQFSGAIHDPFCGVGTVVDAAIRAGYEATGSDLNDHDGKGRFPLGDWMLETRRFDNIVTNPPYKFCFDKGAVPTLKALHLARRKVAMIMPTTRLHAAHKWLKDTPLRRIWLMTPRPSMPPGELILAGVKPGGGTIDFCWAVWERGYTGPIELRWLCRDKKEGAR